MTTLETLKILCAAPGVAGEEFPASEAAARLLREVSDDVETDAFGNVTAILPGEDGAPVILLDAHIDQIGLAVTHIEENGFVRAASCGGMDRRLLPGQEVCILGREPIPGIAAVKPLHLSSGEEKEKVPEITGLAIDTGFPAEALRERVQPGDRIALCGEFLELQNGWVSSPSLDDRAGVAAILHALRLLKLRQLQGKALPYTVCALFSVQEETGGSGAAISAFRLKPDEAIAVDVSFARSEGVPARFPRLGDGAMIGIAPILNRGMFDELLALAKERDIPHAIEAMGGETGTNADGIAPAAGGVRTGLISIPQRYMHTPVEVVSPADVEAVGKLIAAYILRDTAEGEEK